MDNKKNEATQQVEYSAIEKSIIDSKATIKEFTYALDEFSERANPKKPTDHRSYVYALCEKTEKGLVPFYIGEGKGVRVWSHEVEADKQIKLLYEKLSDENRLEEFEDEKQDLKEKISKIDEIKSRNGTIVKYIIKWGMTSEEAFMAESALINLLHIDGLRFDSSGNEDKLTNIVKGHQSVGEKQTGSTKARTVEEFCEEFAKEPLYFEELQEKKIKAVLININRGYPECLKYAEEKERKKAIKDTVCGNWVLSIDNLEKLGIEYVFATVQARVVGIYRIKEVGGKKYHCFYEAAYDNSEYPHGENTVPFRNDDYEFAKLIMKVADDNGKQPFEVVLDDMPSEYREEFIEKVKQKNKKLETKDDFDKSFLNIFSRVYMILEDISEDDPNYNEFVDYLHRRIIHTDEWVNDEKNRREEEKKKSIEKGKTDYKKPENVTNNVYGSGKPTKYIL